mmetsp:Transcript_11050/g.23921  ORF Transcript_11050/g.23921 Transcript_11050/m.23921 type:complete len:206 (+) Transcript_11050:941-1558(+)
MVSDFFAGLAGEVEVPTDPSHRLRMVRIRVVLPEELGATTSVTSPGLSTTLTLDTIALRFFFLFLEMVPPSESVILGGFFVHPIFSVRNGPMMAVRKLGAPGRSSSSSSSVSSSSPSFFFFFFFLVSSFSTVRSRMAIGAAISQIPVMPSKCSLRNEASDFSGWSWFSLPVTSPMPSSPPPPFFSSFLLVAVADPDPDPGILQYC